MKNKRNLFIIAWLVLILISTSYGQSKAAELPQEEPPAQGVPTQVPTLPVELYQFTATPGMDGGIRHVVLEGQFLYNIVELYGVSLDAILALNGLTADSVIHPGDILVIVKGGDLPLETPTTEANLLETTPSSTATEDVLDQLVLPEEITPEATPQEKLGFFERVFSSKAKFLALGVLALVLFGVVLLVISSRRIQ
ncbi:MAG: LysM peptidoglycan-binding domain-containing protein [Anaerolineaceae bacterium]|jgi:LysM repeat protein